MPSTRQESQSSRKPSTYERVAARVDDSKPRIQLWRYLRNNPGATQKQILDDDTTTAERFNNRGAISNYLGDLRDVGIVRKQSREGNEPDLWFVTQEFQSEPEKVVEERVEKEVVEKEVPRYDSMVGWAVDHGVLLGAILFLAVFGGSISVYELLVTSVGNWPEPLFFGSILGLASALSVGVKEVYLDG